jgi:hypothetical protein
MGKRLCGEEKTHEEGGAHRGIERSSARFVTHAQEREVARREEKTRELNLMERRLELDARRLAMEEARTRFHSPGNRSPEF